MAHQRHGVTLIEVLVVVTIIGVLLAVTLPALQTAREAGRRVDCQQRLRQLGIAVSQRVEREGALPIGCIGCKLSLPPAGGPPALQRFISWNVQLLPFLEQPALYDAFDFSLPSYRMENKAVAGTVVEVFLCPSTVESALNQPRGLWQGAAFSDFAGIYGVEGEGRTATDPDAPHWLRDDSLGVMLYELPVSPREIVDGLTRTACIAETMLRRQTESEWINGHNVFAQEASTRINVASGIGNDIGGPHRGGASVVFCDGHAEFLAESIQERVLIGLLTKAGGEL